MRFIYHFCVLTNKKGAWQVSLAEMGNKQFKAADGDIRANMWIGRSPCKYRAITNVADCNYNLMKDISSTCKPGGRRLTKQGPPGDPSQHVTVLIRCLHGRCWNLTVYPIKANPTGRCLADIFSISLTPKTFGRRPLTFKWYLNFDGCRLMSKTFSGYRLIATSAWQAPSDSFRFRVKETSSGGHSLSLKHMFGVYDKVLQYI